MAKHKSINALSAKSLSILETMGDNIKIAIKRRRLKRKDVADRALISEPTLRAILRGDPTVSIGNYVSVLSVISLDDDIKSIADPSQDAVGIALNNRHLPERIRSKDSKYDF